MIASDTGSASTVAADASTVAVFVYLQPLIGFLLAVFFLNEQIGTFFIVAALLIFLGVFLVSKKWAQNET